MCLLSLLFLCLRCLDLHFTEKKTEVQRVVPIIKWHRREFNPRATTSSLPSLQDTLSCLILIEWSCWTFRSNFSECSFPKHLIPVNATHGQLGHVPTLQGEGWLTVLALPLQPSLQPKCRAQLASSRLTTLLKGYMMWIWVICGFLSTTKWIQLVFHLWKESS